TEQKSSFSYNWFKQIVKDGTTLSLPVITKSEAWLITKPYAEAMAKRYTDLPLRFWYLDGILPGEYKLGDTYLDLAQVSNEKGESVLNYKNIPNSILNNYFTILGIGSASHYTEAE